jgi:hypothetical protein
MAGAKGRSDEQRLRELTIKIERKKKAEELKKTINASREALKKLRSKT